MQSVSSRIWTRIAVFISYSDNDYTTGTSFQVNMIGYIKVYTTSFIYSIALIMIVLQ